MVLTGDDRSINGKSRLLHGTWYLQDAGVRETAEVSSDNGKNWKPLFDIIFKPAKSAQHTAATNEEALIELETSWLHAENDPRILLIMNEQRRN